MDSPATRLRALLDGLRLAHIRTNCGRLGDSCTCGADTHNARVEELRATIREAAIEAAAATAWNLDTKTPEQRVACFEYVRELVAGKRTPLLTDGPMINVLRVFGIEVKRG